MVRMRTAATAVDGANMEAHRPARSERGAPRSLEKSWRKVPKPPAQSKRRFARGAFLARARFRAHDRNRPRLGVEIDFRPAMALGGRGVWQPGFRRRARLAAAAGFRSASRGIWSSPWRFCCLPCGRRSRFRRSGRAGQCRQPRRSTATAAPPAVTARPSPASKRPTLATDRPCARTARMNAGASEGPTAQTIA